MSAKTSRKDILAQVADTILKNRQDTYGPPEDSFSTIADLWTVYLSKHTPGPLQAHDVAALMSLLKVARIMAKPTHIDNWVDLSGYGACGGELAGLFAALQESKPMGRSPETESVRPMNSDLTREEMRTISALAHELRLATIVKWSQEQKDFMDFCILTPKNAIWSDFLRLTNLQNEPKQ